MKELLAKLEAARIALGKAKTVDELAAAIATADNANTEYAAAAKKETFKKLEAAESPIKAAVAMLEYPVQKVAYKLDGASLKSANITVVNTMIDLLEFCQYAGLSDYWKLDCERLQQKLKAVTCRDLGAKLSGAAQKAIDENLTTSPKQFVPLLQATVDAIIPGYFITKHDTKFLIGCCAKEGKKGVAMTVYKHADFRRVVTKILHKLETKKTYEVM
jgi:hypothetical protein